MKVQKGKLQKERSNEAARKKVKECTREVLERKHEQVKKGHRVKKGKQQSRRKKKPKRDVEGKRKTGNTSKDRIVNKMLEREESKKSANRNCKRGTSRGR